MTALQIAALIAGTWAICLTLLLIAIKRWDDYMHPEGQGE